MPPKSRKYENPGTFRIGPKRAAEYVRTLRALSKVKVAVVGDIVADEYITGSCERISREAPVLILRHQDSRITPGGAGNAAANVAALGATVFPVGVLGREREASGVMEFFRKNGISRATTLVSPSYRTCVKTRIMSGSLHTTLQQVIRIDRGGDAAVGDADAKRLLDGFEKIVGGLDSVLISDYNCGLFTDYFCDRLQYILKKEYAKRRIFVVVDSRHRLFDFKDAYIATPNESEAREASGVHIVDKKSLVECGRALLEKTGDRAMLITRGSEGMAFFDEEGALHEIPITRRDEIADVTGAGDTVAAVLASTLPVTAQDRVVSVELANIAGGVKVMKRGTAQVSAAEIACEIRRIENFQK